MKALFFNAHGGLEQLQYGELPDPIPSPGHVIVRVRACAINHLDLWVLQGWKGLNLPLPHIGGADIAGDIMDRADDVRGWRKGALVAVSPGFVPKNARDEFTERGEDSLSPRYEIFGETRRGGFAEYVEVPAECLVAIPPGVGFTQAAAPLLAGTTSWRMLQHRAKLQKGETVVVVGAGGGVNSFSILLAHSMGARVIVLTTKKEKIQKAESLGADSVILIPDFPEWAKEVKRLTNGRGADVVIDNVGAATITQSLYALCRGGRLVTVGNTSGPHLQLDNRLIFSKQVSIIGSTMGSYQDFRDAANFAWSKPPGTFIDREIGLKDGREAYQRLLAGEQSGKIVLIP